MEDGGGGGGGRLGGISTCACNLRPLISSGIIG